MDSNPDCPVCATKGWEVFRFYDYTSDMNGALGDYPRSRMQVLFNVWAPGSIEVRLSGVLCTGCGYVTYSPRPTAEDIESKYRYQLRLNPEQGVNRNRDALRLDASRARKVFSRLQPFLPSGKLRVLDYGGGDGKLLVPFLQEGHESYLIDYNQNPLPGVGYLGSSLGTLVPESTFDVILCSHVLEHLAEPRKVLSKLASHLAPMGLIYSEVPAELFDGIPIERDPVTHVGFFCKPTFEALLRLNGLRILKSRGQVGTYNENSLHIIWCVAARARSEAPKACDLAEAVWSARRYLHPGVARRVIRHYHPLLIAGQVRQLFHYHHPTRKLARRLGRRVRAGLSFVLGH